MHRNFAWFLGFLAIFYIASDCDANAAPTVKKLGANSATTVKTTTLPTKSSNTSRVGSIRSNATTSTVKPVTVAKPVTITKTNVAKSDDAEQRLSVGKYIHTTGVTSGVIKPIASAESATTASNEIVSLNDRVSDLATKVDNKQDILNPINVVSSGDGIVVTAVEANNGTVVVTKDEISVPIGEPGATNRAPIWVEQ